MIIFGTRGVTMSSAKGTFHCPSCGAGSAYDHKRVRRFFTLYFIPLIPLDLLGEYVECQACRGTYKADVLAWDPVAEDAHFREACHEATLRVMIRMTAADGRIAPDEVAAVRGVYQQLTGKQLEQAEVERECAAIMGSAGSVRSDLERIAGRLNDHGKEVVLKAAFLVAGADGSLAEAEKKLVLEVGLTLGMSAAHVKGVLADVMSPVP